MDINLWIYFIPKTVRYNSESISKTIIRVIPQGTVDNNLGPDRLAGPKALDPIMVLSCACFGPRHSTYSYYWCRASDIAAVGTTFNVFSYDASWAENWTYHLPNAGRMRFQLHHRRGNSKTITKRMYLYLKEMIFNFLISSFIWYIHHIDSQNDKVLCNKLTNFMIKS